MTNQVSLDLFDVPSNGYNRQNFILHYVKFFDVATAMPAKFNFAQNKICSLSLIHGKPNKSILCEKPAGNCDYKIKLLAGK